MIMCGARGRSGAGAAPPPCPSGQRSDAHPCLPAPCQAPAPAAAPSSNCWLPPSLPPSPPQVSSLQTDLSADKRREATNAAREIAVADAAGTAEILAQAAAVTLGAIKSLSDSNVAPPTPLYMAAGAGGWTGGRGGEVGRVEGGCKAAKGPAVRLPEGLLAPNRARHWVLPLCPAEMAMDAGKQTPTPVQLGTTDVSPRLPAPACLPLAACRRRRCRQCHGNTHKRSAGDHGSEAAASRPASKHARAVTPLSADCTQPAVPREEAPPR